jgi:transketolase
MSAELPSQLDARKIRGLILQILEKSRSGHAGGPLGMADVFAVLYRDIVHHNPKDPRWSQRDRVLLSNGHICPVLYATLALHGYFPKSELDVVRTIGSRLQGHPAVDLEYGLENASGPLGQGLSQAVGVALAANLRGAKHHIFAMLSDGEHQEGQIWEAYQSGAKFGLKNLTAVIDRNFIQISGVTERVMPLESLPEKLRAFGWLVYEVNGHDHVQLRETLLTAKADGEPSVVVAYTHPGKGVPEIENKFSWHGYIAGSIDATAAIKALNTLDGFLEGEYVSK